MNDQSLKENNDQILSKSMFQKKILCYINKTVLMHLLIAPYPVEAVNAESFWNVLWIGNP